MNVGWQIARSSALFLVALGLVIFLPAGTLNYWQAWLMLAVYVACAAAMVAFLKATDAPALERRARGPLEEQSPTQLRIAIAVIICYFAVYVVAALDHRFGWSSAPPWVAFLGNALFIASFILFSFVMRTNPFAATNIAVESGQTVATTGPYAVVRHPMYSGVFIMVVGISLALGSYWGVLLVLPIAMLFSVRLLDEEQFLIKNLPGYAEYCTQTRWRLVPGIFVVLVVLLLSTADATQYVNGDPSKVQIVTSDIGRFWRAYDDAQRSADPAQTYGTEYFALGTNGLWGFVPDRLVSPRHLASVVQKYRDYYVAARPYMMHIADERAAIFADLQRFKRADPDATFPDIYFVVGALNSAGTSVDGVGLVLGAEMLSRPPNLSGIALPGFNAMVLSAIDRIPPTVAHELTHFNQHNADQQTLLGFAIQEGTADFMSQLVDGHNAVPAQWTFGCANEDALWAAFSKDMQSTDASVRTPWLFSYDTGPLGAPPFIGYWVGSRVVQTFYDAQSDKHVAVATILNIKDFNVFLKQSGYPAHRPPCRPQARMQ